MGQDIAVCESHTYTLSAWFFVVGVGTTDDDQLDLYFMHGDLSYGNHFAPAFVFGQYSGNLGVWTQVSYEFKNSDVDTTGNMLFQLFQQGNGNGEYFLIYIDDWEIDDVGTCGTDQTLFK